MAVCPPYVYLETVGQALAGSAIGLGAQNVSAERDGAFTGEISVSMLTDLGCQFVILGHSERRTLMGETDAIVLKKAQAALAGGLTPIICVGESLAQRQAQETQTVIARQFEESVCGLTPQQVEKVVLAYEPIWAIGTGQVATPQQAEEVHSHLRKLLSGRYNGQLAEMVRLLYGGSVKPSNAAELLGQPNVDGALVGGASLVADDFLGIFKAAQSAK